MEVDVPVSRDVTFTSEASKGKRSAANLPVEAEDTLPWFVWPQSVDTPTIGYDAAV
jgi:replication factor C subunit 3/5